MKFSNFMGKVLLRTFATLAVIVLISAGAFLAVRQAGKGALYGSADSDNPKLELETAGDSYEEGDILYRGEAYRYNDDILTFLVMGIDSLEPLPKADEVEDYTLGGQADTLFLVVADPHKKEISVVAINRNSMTEIDVYSPENEYVRTDLLQICLQHGYGSGLEDSCERQVKAVSRLFFDLPIHGYVSMNMAAVPLLNDCVGGVKLEVIENVPWGTDVIADGLGNVVTLEGMDAYYYLQYRDVEVFDSASMRLARQKQYLMAFANQSVVLAKKDITFPLTVYHTLSDYMVTDVSPVRIAYLTTELLGYSFHTDSLYSLQGETVTGGGGFEEFYVDDEALYDLIIRLFYEKVDA